MLKPPPWPPSCAKAGPTAPTASPNATSPKSAPKRTKTPGSGPSFLHGLCRTHAYGRGRVEMRDLTPSYNFSAFVKLFLFVLFQFDESYAGVYRHQRTKVSHVRRCTRSARATGRRQISR